MHIPPKDINVWHKTAVEANERFSCDNILHPCVISIIPVTNACMVLFGILSMGNISVIIKNIDIKTPIESMLKTEEYIVSFKIFFDAIY